MAGLSSVPCGFLIGHCALLYVRVRLSGAARTQGYGLSLGYFALLRRVSLYYSSVKPIGGAELADPYSGASTMVAVRAV